MLEPDAFAACASPACGFRFRSELLRSRPAILWQNIVVKNLILQSMLPDGGSVPSCLTRCDGS
jgi:hypothetical protein